MTEAAITPAARSRNLGIDKSPAFDRGKDRNGSIEKQPTLSAAQATARKASEDVPRRPIVTTNDHVRLRGLTGLPSTQQSGIHLRAASSSTTDIRPIDQHADACRA